MQGRVFLIILIVHAFSSHGIAQMVHGQDTLTGQEWINYNETYFKFTVEADGVYRIPYDALISAGIPAGVRGLDFKLFSLGVQVAIYTSTDDLTPMTLLSFMDIKTGANSIGFFLKKRTRTCSIHPTACIRTEGLII